MKVRSLVLAVLCAAAGVTCTSGPPPPELEAPYGADIEQARAAKDRMFTSGDQSPLRPEDKAAFTGLPYYPIDPAYRVPASLSLDSAGGGAVILLPTSKDQMRRMRRVGVLRFRLRGEPLELTAFADAEARTVDSLFVPFGDLTNREETYGGGRYLDLDRTSTGLYDLDFNRAYHPYCVFNIDYECPVPPPENRLQIAIPAGERLPPQ